MTFAATTIRPGLLVSLKTSCRGNVSYRRRDLVQEANMASWETTRTTADAAEYEQAKKVQTTVSNMIRAVCINSSDWLLCPQSRADMFKDACEKARALVTEFNRGAMFTRVELKVLTGKIASDDIEAIKALNSEIANLLGTMQFGVDTLDIKSIRAAANKATQLSAMLSPDAERTVQKAVREARRVARKLAKQAEGAAGEVDRIAIAAVTEARTAFLDLDQEPVAIERPVAESRAIDFEKENGNAL